jgi:cellulose biosynthesis protein BcsQ
MGKIITFYSYKGGVGRSMALANMGVILAQWGYKVLIIDFDLEAPGIENFFSSFLDVDEVLMRRGIVDILCKNLLDFFPGFSNDFLGDDILRLRLPLTTGELQLLTAGKRDSSYYKNVKRLDFSKIYETMNAGNIIESFREEIKKEYDFILIDSRTGLTEIGGVCTVQLPDYIALIFTPTEQAFLGGVDIIQRAIKSRQRLPYERFNVHTVPVPSRFDMQAEYRLSRAWLDRFSRDLKEIYSDWLPRYVNPRNILEVMKLPQISFFSYGETLPVLEQGTSDPSSLGYAYENLAALFANELQNADLLIKNRDTYIKSAIREKSDKADKDSQANIFISYSHKDKNWVDKLKVMLTPIMRSRNITLWDDTMIRADQNWKDEISNALANADVAILLVSPDFLASDFIQQVEVPHLLKASEERGLNIFWIAIRPSFFDETPIGQFQAINDPSKPLSTLSESEVEKSLLSISKRVAEVAGRKY